VLRVHESELVGGVLFDAKDPFESAQALVELLMADRVDPAKARSAGLEPVLVESLKRKLPRDRHSIELACSNGAAWVLGRRSAPAEGNWEVVASISGRALPPGLRRTTGETMIGMITEARARIRLTTSFVDEAGLRFLIEPIAAATRRGVSVDVFDPHGWMPARAALEALTDEVIAAGDRSRLTLIQAPPDASFAHLKVLVVDRSAAYIGSANITGAGLAGRNLELGVLVHGHEVAVIDAILDMYQQRSETGHLGLRT
jgi:phosphatidylserine/phosphatidylglycerophosphate/cardiolipin synthase-like enzyme